MALHPKPRPGESSKYPATPNRKAGKSSLYSQAPSTTPAGEPPSYLTNKSTTPGTRPPRSSKIFGSSYNAANNTFGHRNTPARRGRAFAVPESSPPPEDEDEDDEDEDDQDGADEVMDEGYGTQTGNQAQHAAFLTSTGMKDSLRGLKRSRNGQVREAADSGMAEIARSYARDAGPAQLHGLDDVVLQTEQVLSASDAVLQGQSLAEMDATITATSARLSDLWAQFAKSKTLEGSIGPEADDPFTKANYLSSLLLQLHNPHITRSATASAGAMSQRALVVAQQNQISPIPVPKALLDWLNTYHKPLGDDFNEVHMYRPSPSAHESFWDLIGGELLRGQFARVTRLLKDAGFENAITAQDDGGGTSGYEGKQLENVEEVVARFVRLLESCPAVRYDDWDVKGGEWSVFRQRVRYAIRDLETFAKGHDGNGDDDNEDGDLPTKPPSNIFAQSANASTFGSMASASIRAGSRVPWSIYENLRVLYGVLLGGDEIIDYAQDWLESSIFLTTWWDGEDTPGLSGTGRVSPRRSRGAAGGGAGTREVDISPLTAYRRRLGDMITTVTAQIEESNFKPDTLDPVQVGLVCVMEDSVETVIELLRSWDQSISTAIVEIAALSGWLPQARPSSRGLLQQGFSSEDLMVLSHGSGPPKSQDNEAVNRDDILAGYADLLAAKDAFHSSDGRVVREGWELAVSVLGRLDNTQAAQTKITEILESMQFHDESRVDKVLELCANMGLTQQARGIAERYADSLAESNSNAYGAALMYYARAHATQKLQSTISLLVSLCLLQSAAVPNIDILDSQLDSLLTKERTALVGLASVDLEAATLLSGHISGYATIRRFYNLRDGGAAGRSLERKREAAKALIAVIESASDCIRGGLFDPEVQSVVPIDGLLSLLGEALPLLGQDKRIFTREQIFTLLRVVEDFDSAPKRIQDGAIELFQASMNAYRRSSSPQPNKKSKSNVSSMSGSGLSGSSWDMVLSSNMLQSEGSERAAETKRGWDWRKGLDAVGGANVEGKQVLMLLRMALAQEVAHGWGGVIGW